MFCEVTAKQSPNYKEIMKEVFERVNSKKLCKVEALRTAVANFSGAPEAPGPRAPGAERATCPQEISHLENLEFPRSDHSGSELLASWRP